MAIIEVPFDYLTIQAAINASSPGDTILVGSSYGGPETPTVTVNNLTFEINAATSGIVLTLSGVSRVQVNGDGDVNVIGTAANETIVGNTGGNTIFGGLGDDVIDGGTGMDTVDYTATTSAIAVDLGDLIGSNVSGGAGQDTLSNIETVQGTDFADTFRGGINAATFYGNDGNDTFIVSSDINAIGGNDDDIFLFDGSITSYSAGNLSGGSGDDRLRFAGSDGTVIDADVDVTSIEIVEFVGGTNTDQTAIFSGDEFDNPVEFAAALQIIGNNSTGSTDTIQIDMRTPTTLDLSQ